MFYQRNVTFPSLCGGLRKMKRSAVEWETVHRSALSLFWYLRGWYSLISWASEWLLIICICVNTDTSINRAPWNDDRRVSQLSAEKSCWKDFHHFLGAASVFKLPSLENQMFWECYLHLCATQSYTNLHGSALDDDFTQFSNFSTVILSIERRLAYKYLFFLSFNPL